MRRKLSSRKKRDHKKTMTNTDNDLMVAIHPDNATNDHFDVFGNCFGIYVLHPECRELITLVRQITVIQPTNDDSIEEDMNIEE